MFKHFWKVIKQACNAMLPSPSNVRGASGAENVIIMWLHHYQLLLKSISDFAVHIHEIDMYCRNIQINDSMVVKI